MDCSTPAFPILHYLWEFAQTYVHWVSDAIQPSHPLSPPSLPAINLSQHQGIFQWVGCLHQVATVLELQLQHQSFQWIFRVYFFQDWLVSSPWCLRDSQESSPAPWLERISSAVLSLLYSCNSYIHHNYWRNHSFAYTDQRIKSIWFQYYLVMYMCRIIYCVVLRWCLLWPLCSLSKTLLAFALLHFVLQGHTCLLLQASCFCIPIPSDENGICFWY